MLHTVAAHDQKWHYATLTTNNKQNGMTISLSTKSKSVSVTLLAYYICTYADDGPIQ